jgi:hypothetical protein
MFLFNSMTKHRNIMHEIPFPSQKRWPVTPKDFPIPLLPNIPTGQDHHLHEERLVKLLSSSR